MQIFYVFGWFLNTTVPWDQPKRKCWKCGNCRYPNSRLILWRKWKSGDRFEFMMNEWVYKESIHLDRVWFKTKTKNTKTISKGKGLISFLQWKILKSTYSTYGNFSIHCSCEQTYVFLHFQLSKLSYIVCQLWHWQPQKGVFILLFFFHFCTWVSLIFIWWGFCDCSIAIEKKWAFGLSFHALVYVKIDFLLISWGFGFTVCIFAHLLINGGDNYYREIYGQVAHKDWNVMGFGCWISNLRLKIKLFVLDC